MNFSRQFVSSLSTGCAGAIFLGSVSILGHAADSSSAATVTSPNAATCNTLLTRYRPLANAHAGENPLRVLTSSAKSGVQMTVEEGGAIPDSDGLKSWAKQQTPPIAVSDEVSETFDQDPQSASLEKAHGVPFFMLSRSEGSMNCDASVFFVVRNGTAQPAQNPLGDSGQGECATSGKFVTLDSKPLYVRENYDWGPGMSASLDVATWRGGYFLAACTLSLSYSPRVSTDTLNQSGDDCEGAGCADMRKAAFDLTTRKVSDDLARDTLMQKLTDKQREIYQSAETAAKDTDDPEASENIVFVPYVLKDEVYVARVADLTVGWRDYADQSVKFEQLNGGKIVEKAAFSIGVKKGDLADASVTAVAVTP